MLMKYLLFTYCYINFVLSFVPNLLKILFWIVIIVMYRISTLFSFTFRLLRHYIINKLENIFLKIKYMLPIINAARVPLNKV